jgi:hypothetical protein
MAVFGLGILGLSVVLMPSSAYATVEGASTGTLTLEITAPATVPPGFVLNPGGTIPSNFAFPDVGNAGNGSFTAIGSASCTPAGCTSPGPGTDLEYQLTTDLTCSADPAGSYGGLEDSFALFGANNMTGGSVTLELRFTTSWLVSATADDPPISDSAEASVDLLWAVPSDFCIALASCPSGSLVGGTVGDCPAGFVEGTVLVLGTREVDNSMGDDMDIGPTTTCDVTVVVLPNASSGGDLSVTSSCLASSSGLIFVDGFELGNLSAWSSYF